MADEYRNPALQIRISPELNDRLTRVADMYGVSKGEIARIAIGQYVGQITGTIDAITKRSSEQFDIRKLAEIMVPLMMEYQSKPDDS